MTNAEMETERLQGLVSSLEAKVRGLEGGSLADARSIQ